MHRFSKPLLIGFVSVFCVFQIIATVPAWGSDKVSKTEPQMLGTPEENLSTLGTSGKKSNVGWWIGGILAVGLVAALAGGGGGGGGDDTTVTPPDSGSVTVGW